MAANRVMNSISGWLKRKLFLKVNASKSKVVRPRQSKYRGFTFLKSDNQWKVKPTSEKKAKLYKVMREYLKRNRAVSRSLSETFVRVNQMVKGWIDYYRIGGMKTFMNEFGQWLRHKIRVIIIKKWKKPKTIFRNLSYFNRKHRNGFNHESIYKVANSRLGWYRQCAMNVVNFILNSKLLEMKKRTDQVWSIL